MAEQPAALLVLVLAAAFFLAAFPAAARSAVGVCYGVNGKALPAASDVVKLYRSRGIDAMRIYFPDHEILRALAGSGIALVMDVADEDIGAIASGTSAAAAWVKANVQPYPGVSFRYIAVGNEVMDADAQSRILPAMKNLQGALCAAGLCGVKVSTAVRFDVIADSYPPSNGVFRDFSAMAPITEFLNSSGGPFMANVYPYFAYSGDHRNIKLEYATFQPGTTVSDDGNGLTYTNLFDAMVDAVHAALEDAGTPDVRVVVSESGWPSAGGFAATANTARRYNQKLIEHVGGGTPMRPGPLETYIFAMFDEDLKTGDDTEQHFGLFKPDRSPAYAINFCEEHGVHH